MVDPIEEEVIRKKRLNKQIKQYNDYLDSLNDTNLPKTGKLGSKKVKDISTNEKNLFKSFHKKDHA